MGNNAENLSEGDQVLRAVYGFNRCVWIVKGFVEFGRLLVGLQEIVGNAGKRFSQKMDEIIGGLFWCFSRHAFASGGAQGSLVPQPLGMCRHRVYDKGPYSID